MKGIIVQDKRRILVRFCHGYEKLIWIGALRLRYEYLSQVELQEMMLNAKLSSAGKWLIFSETRQSVSVWTKKLSSHFRNSRWTVIWPLDDLHKTGGGFAFCSVRLLMLAVIGLGTSFCSKPRKKDIISWKIYNLNIRKRFLMVNTMYEFTFYDII